MKTNNLRFLMILVATVLFSLVLLSAFSEAACGDRKCDPGECTICPKDCTNCGITPPKPTPKCGDNICNGAESCSSCSHDCGSCPIVEKCGDGLINLAGEECEYPTTNDNTYCSQATTDCDGKKQGTRDTLGNCNSECNCVKDSFTNYQCVKGKCGAECSANSDCDDGNSHTTDSCTDGCSCTHIYVPYCGDGDINPGEQCEFPNTINNPNCHNPSTTVCNGQQLGTRDIYGNCGSLCGCTQDPFYYTCVAGFCGAECSTGQTQAEACGSNVGECRPGTRTRACLEGTCSFGEWGECTGALDPTEELCDNKDNDCDGLIDEDLTKSCGSESCSGAQTCINGEWSACDSEGSDAGTCALCDANGNIRYDPTQNYDCNDELFCDGEESCAAIGQCSAGTPVSCSDSLFCTLNERCDETLDACVSDPKDCSGNDLPDLETCGNVPDGNPFTWDFAEGGFISQCDDQHDICTQGTYTDITHTCSIGLCNADCEADSDCIAGHSCSTSCVCTCSPSSEICDGKDNDCDGKIDEDNICGPKIISTPLKRMCLDQLDHSSNIYTYDVDALDIDDPVLYYNLVEFPADMSIDSSTGLISWPIEQEDLGLANVVVKVEDQVFTTIDSTCPSIIAPMCARNGNTFRNICELAAADQELWHEGYCYDLQSYALEICEPGEEIYPRRKYEFEQLQILSDEPICAGDTLSLLITLSNNGLWTNKDIKITAVVADLAVRRTTGPFTLAADDEITKRIDLELPDYADEGMYDVRVYLYSDSGDFIRIKHREFQVKQCDKYSCERDSPICKEEDC